MSKPTPDKNAPMAAGDDSTYQTIISLLSDMVVRAHINQATEEGTE